MRRIFNILLLLCTLTAVAQTDCLTGSLLFKEDFGGNSPDDPQVGTTPIASMSSNYSMKTSRASGAYSGMYLTTKYGHANGADWHMQDDHTFPNDTSRGYFLQVDARGTSNDIFYSATIDNICTNTKLYFSAWVANVFTVYRAKNLGGSITAPNFKFSMVNPDNGIEYASYKTGPVPMDTMSMPPVSDDIKKSSKWHQYGFVFNVPDHVSKVRLQIMNSAGSGIGNDFGIDDIEIYLCTPPVEVAGSTEVCSNQSITLNGSFQNDGTFEEPLAYQWLFSQTGEINSTWETLVGQNKPTLQLKNVQKADSGYYRLAVSTEQNIINPTCRASSMPYLLKVEDCKITPKADFNITIDMPLCADSLLNFTLSVLSDTIDSISFILNGNSQPYIPTYAPIQQASVPLTYVKGFNRIEIDAFRADTLVKPRITFDYAKVEQCVEEEPKPNFKITVDTVLCADTLLPFSYALLTKPIDSVLFCLPTDTAVFIPTATAHDTVLHINLKAGIYTLTTIGYAKGASVKSINHNIKVLFPSNSIIQKWNDFVGVQTYNYNGGYEFVAYQWYRNDTLLVGETNDYLYQPLIIGAEYAALLTDSTGLQLMCCPIIAQTHYDITPYPVPAVAKQMIGVSLPAEAQVSVFDIYGHTLYQRQLPVGRHQLLENMNVGVYIMQIITSSQYAPITYKILLQ